MKRFLTAILTIGAMLGSGAAASAQELVTSTKYTFDSDSPLATGNWVKVSIGETGVYEISYDKLREMGFNNPKAVMVYGTGGQKRGCNFLDINDKRVIEDNLQPVPVMHDSAHSKLIFYGQGDRMMKFTSVSNNSTKYPCFRRTNLNPYSETSWYMLTDSKPVVSVDTPQVHSKSQAEGATPYGYVYDEQEIFNGGADSGEIWWGPNVSTSDNFRLDFEVKAKYCAPYDVNKPEERPTAYAEFAVASGYDATFVIQLNEGSRQISLGNLGSTTYQAWDMTQAGSQFSEIDADNVGSGTISFYLAPNKEGNINFEYGKPLYVDYWAVTYPTSFALLDEDPNFTQFTVGFNHKSSAPWKHTAPTNAKVWDVTNPLSPFEMEVYRNEVYNSSRSPVKAVAFRPDRQLLQIGEYKKVANQNLHALQRDEAYDMIIFTVPAVKQYAEQLAEVHAQTDGQRAAVVVAEDLYNEFNAGTPDAMCYRLMAKMLYHHPDQKLKNLLFFGPVHGDFRNLRRIPNRVEGLIAFQDNNLDLQSISNPNMDFYGIMADNVKYLSKLDSAPISLGVGVLPIYDDQDGQLIVDKIRAHLTKEDFSGLVNEIFTIGCKGDSHIHENQSIRHGRRIQDFVEHNLDSEYALESLWLEAMTPQQGRDRIQSAMRRGKALVTYFGHAVLNGFDAMTTFDAMHAGNKEQGLAIFAGCELVEPDHGMHGMGDMPVIRSREGFIGIISASRSVLSNQNESLVTNITNSFFLDHNGEFRTQTPTLGEVYARAKHLNENNSEMAYFYIGDPSLRVPMALKKVRLTIPQRRYRAGEVVEVSGQVFDLNNSLMSDYNGHVTLKLMEPTRMVVTPPVSSATQAKMDDYPINDLPILAVNGPVKDGCFTLRVPLPDAVDSFTSEAEDNITNLLLLAGTFDSSSWLGGTGRVNIPMAVAGSTPDADAPVDTRAPQVTVIYDKALSVIKVWAHDDVAMVGGIGPNAGVSLYIDNQEMILENNDYSEDVYVTNYNGSVDMARLSNGSHTARVIARDLCGNVSEEKTLNFQVTSTASLQLASENTVAVDSVDFTLSNGDDDFLTLYVADRNGNVVSETEVSGNRFSLDTTEIPSGTYRAYVHRNTPEGSRVHSNQVEFTVID